MGINARAFTRQVRNVMPPVYISRRGIGVCGSKYTAVEDREPPRIRVDVVDLSLASASAVATAYSPTRGATTRHAGAVESQLFEEIGDALRGMLPPDLGALRLRVRRYGIKVWFGPGDPPREHYEAQVIGADAVEDATVLALEIGFHAEHSQVADNKRVIARIEEQESSWRPTVGDAAVAGPFIGRAKSWRRVSETWPDPDLGDPELAIEVAAQLADYITALEPARAAAAST